MEELIYETPLTPRTLELPRDLLGAITAALAAMPSKHWIREAQLLSERYRAVRTGGERPLASSQSEALAYAALVFPATYAQLRGAMGAAAARASGWQPASLLDMGSGPGTALWAATAQWPSLRSLVAWERESSLIALGRNLARGSDTPAVRAARWDRVDLTQLPTQTTQRYDLVVLGHVLNELAPTVQQRVVEYAWQLTDGVLLLVESGTPAAFAVVRTARDQLLAAGARTLAPCAHDQPCPLVNDWCHFPQRLQRPEFQRRARGAPSPWEDSKFSYAALARFGPEHPVWARVITEVTSNKAYAEVKVSTQSGISHLRALKRHREAYRELRDLPWGAALAVTPPELVEEITHERLSEETKDERRKTKV